ncbi:MAG: hypothetical protein A2170_09710 [Deltaproteobacteria bacterium RBG_13_53_10]|nr:MAG: hypothetical protein A2170_09710 [Deltaproteobacteria bacterium RBG_13_53_10]
MLEHYPERTEIVAMPYGSAQDAHGRQLNGILRRFLPGEAKGGTDYGLSLTERHCRAIQDCKGRSRRAVTKGERVLPLS